MANFDDQPDLFIKMVSLCLKKSVQFTEGSPVCPPVASCQINNHNPSGISSNSIKPWNYSGAHMICRDYLTVMTHDRGPWTITSKTSCDFYAKWKLTRGFIHDRAVSGHFFGRLGTTAQKASAEAVFKVQKVQNKDMLFTRITT